MCAWDSFLAYCDSTNFLSHSGTLFKPQKVEKHFPKLFPRPAWLNNSNLLSSGLRERGLIQERPFREMDFTKARERKSIFNCPHPLVLGANQIIRNTFDPPYDIFLSKVTFF